MYKFNFAEGVEHADDLLYVMNRRHIAPFFQPNDPETLAVERSTRMWEYFANTGYKFCEFSNIIIIIIPPNFI